MNHVHSRLIIFSLATALALTACGDDDADEPAADPSTTEAPQFTDASGRTLVWADFGGLHNEAAVDVFLDPWAAVSGGVHASDIVDDTRFFADGEIPWDIANSNRFIIDLGCTPDGWSTPLDTAVVGTADYPAEFVGDCWIAPWYFGGILAYNPDLVPRPPTSWADFFNTAEFPGKRGAVDFDGFGYQWEMGLMAQGVPAAEVYPTLTGANEDEGRAQMLRALEPWDAIKDDVIFQAYGPEQLAQLDQGEVVMAAVSTPRAAAAIQDGANIELVWETSMIGLNTFVVPTDSTNKDIAMEVLNYLLDPDEQLEFARQSYFGPHQPGRAGGGRGGPGPVRARAELP